jgi:hypothetical protein
VNVRRFLPAIFGLAVFVCLTSVASASGASGLARYLASDTDRVELENGHGVATFTARGAMFGYVRRGSVRIVDLRRGRDTVISVDGAERRREISDRVTVYRGRRISFYVERGWWKVRIQGHDIDAGAAVHGRLALKGRSGKFALRDGTSRDWPRQRRVFRLG